MKHGQIARSTSINAAIYRCFEYIPEEDEKAFVKKFGEQPHDQDQVMHTFRELILGAFLGFQGYTVRYDQSLGGKTPDWSILDENRTLRCIVELVNFHTERATEDEIKRHLRARNMWCGWTGPHANRLYDRLWEKASKYTQLAEQMGVAYVIALFSEFNANIELAEVQDCLSDKEKGLFSLYPSVSGLLFFEESSGRYPFTYIRNPDGIREIALPCGLF
jgi:hypothetical protein